MRNALSGLAILAVLISFWAVVWLAHKESQREHSFVHQLERIADALEKAAR